VLAIILAACDWGNPSDTTPPAQVSGLTATPGNGQVTLTWTDPTDTDLASIEITWTPGGTTPQTVAKGTQSKTITGLTNGTPYTFTVKAKDNAGNLSTGEPTTATPNSSATPNTPSDTPAPDPVSGLTATPGNGQVTLTWTNPTDTDRAFIQITWTSSGTTPQTADYDKETQSKTITGLTNGTEYTFTVKAKDNAGNLSTGQTTTAKPTSSTTPNTPDTPPAPVSGLTATPGDTQVTLTWTNPTDTDRAFIQITWTSSGTTPQTADYDKETESEIIDGLTNGTEYTFTVKAKDNAGNLSDEVTTTAKPTSSTAAQVTVNFTGPQDETIYLNGDGAFLSQAENTLISVSVSGSFTAYRWFLDGVLMEGETGNSISANTGYLAIKRHELTVFVTSGGVEYAKSMHFTITE
jgi:hypothetical protein